jgi:hypothetical protein
MVILTSLHVSITSETLSTAGLSASVTSLILMKRSRLGSRLSVSTQMIALAGLEFFTTLQIPS